MEELFKTLPVYLATHELDEPFLSSYQYTFSKCTEKGFFTKAKGWFIIHTSRYFKYAWTGLCVACVLWRSLHQRTRHAIATDNSCCAMLHTFAELPHVFYILSNFHFKHTQWSRMSPLQWWRLVTVDDDDGHPGRKDFWTSSPIVPKCAKTVT